MGDTSLQNAVAVVTGASRGIGRAIAIALARAGAHVVCTARSTITNPSKLAGTVEETARQITIAGGRALAIVCDVSREEQVEALARRTLAECGRIDVLINNAAVNFKGVSFSELPLKRWDLLLNVDLRGPVLCTKAFLPQMLRQQSGRVINISSGAAVDPEITAQFGLLPYAVAKAGLETFTRGLAREVSAHGIAVNALRIETYVASEGAIMFNPDANYSSWEKPETVGDQVVWLATRDPSYTGHVVTMADIRAAQVV